MCEKGALNGRKFDMPLSYFMSQIDFTKGSEAVQPLFKGSVVVLYTACQHTHIVTSYNWFLMVILWHCVTLVAG
jgi:hypothetical protein